MKRRDRIALLLVSTLLVVMALPTPGRAQNATPSDQSARDFTQNFYLDACDWASTDGNLFMQLESGRQHVLQGKEDGETVQVIDTVLDQTKVIDGVETRVAEAWELQGGEVVEHTYDYYAVCAPRNDIFYFGEEVDNFEHGQVVNHEGTWLAGKSGNQPGLIMPAQPLLGARYYQELAPGVAMDRSEIIQMAIQMTTPAGTFDDCFRTVDTTPLEPEVRDQKVYCPEVGNVLDEALKLIYVGPATGGPVATPNP